MNDLRINLVIGVGIACFVGGIIGYVILSPNPWNPKEQWLKKSVISSYVGMFGFFILLLTLDQNDLINELQALDYGAIWKSVWSILVYILLGGILLTTGTYLKVSMGSIYSAITQQWLRNRNERKK
jgi:hypothetical protein